MRLKALTLNDLYRIAEWRNQDIAPFRTPDYLTESNQQSYYEKVSQSHTMYMWSIMAEIYIGPETRLIDHYGIHDPEKLVGYGGLENIDWVNRTAEVSLFIAPDERSRGYGSGAFALILEKAFDTFGLHTVWGEVYYTTSAPSFWLKEMSKYGGNTYHMNHRKYYNGIWYNARGFDITADVWRYNR
jgi:RimJ/RimL family protein N-acetyltransferase